MSELVICCDLWPESLQLQYNHGSLELNLPFSITESWVDMMTKKPGLLKKIFFFIIQYILEPFDKNDTGIFRLFFIPGTDITLSYYQDTHF